MTKSLQALGKEAQSKHKKIIDLKKTLSVGFLIIGKELRDMKQNEYWKFIVGEDLNWGDYCRELDFNQNYANTLINIYERFILQLGMKEGEVAKVDQRKLIALLPLTVNKSKVLGLIEDAKVLSREDFFLKIHQERNPPEKCKHVWKDISYSYCEKCREKEYKGK